MGKKLQLIAAMLIFGTLGIFVERTSVPTAVLAFYRAAAGTLFLLFIILIRKQKIRWEIIRKNALLLIASGAAIGFNWIFLFEAYRYTTVAVATLCYYMAPVFIVLLSPFVLKEKLTGKGVLCAAAAVFGAVLISGAAAGNGQDIRGILFGLCAASFYCSIVLMNKKTAGLTAMEITVSQLFVAGLIMFPYALITQGMHSFFLSGQDLVIALILGIVHTGFAYYLFFGSMTSMKAQEAAVLSYIDPVTAILLSALILSQPISTVQIIGSVLILGSTLVNELIREGKS